MRSKVHVSRWLVGVVAMLMGWGAWPAEAGAKQIILGVRNYTDLPNGEFKEPPYSGQPPVDLETHGAADIPKEFNDYGLTNQVFTFSLTAGEASADLAVTLNPSWCQEAGALTVALEALKGGQWVMAGSADLRTQQPATLFIAPSNLVTGVNTIRLRTLHGNGACHILVWDQIILESKGGPLQVTMGVWDKSGDEFKQDSYGNWSGAVDLDHDAATNFPKEMNDSWHSTQTCFFVLGPGGIGKEVALLMRPAWSQGDGSLTIALDVLEGAAWQTVGAVDLRHQQPQALLIPQSNLVLGVNNIRLRTASANGDTHALVWDQVIIENKSAGALFLLGARDQSSDDFKAPPFTGEAIDLDHQAASDFPREFNNTWFTNQAFYMTLSSEAATKDLSVTLNPAWSQSNETLTVALDIDNGTTWAEVNRATVGPGLIGNFVVIHVNLNPGINAFRLRSAETNAGPRAVTWDQIVVESKADAAEIVLGTVDLSSDEFKQDDYGNTSPPVDIDHQAAADFPEKLNNSWNSTQQFYFILTPVAARDDFAVILNPAWTYQCSSLRTAVEVFRGWPPDWQEVGRVDVLNQTPNVVIVPSSYLGAGLNQVRLRCVETGSTACAVGWDQIIMAGLPDSLCRILGSRDQSSAEFKQSGFGNDGRWIDIDHQAASNFPKELNDSWNSTQLFSFVLNDVAASKDLFVTLDPAWLDASNGTLTVALDRYNGSSWSELARTEVGDLLTGLMLVPSSNLAAGANRMRLRTVQGNGGAHALTWDQIIVETKNDSMQVALGVRDVSSDEFLQSGFGNESEPFDVDHQPEAQLPREFNDSWHSTQGLYFVLGQAAAEKNLTLTLVPAWSDAPSGTLNVAVDVLNGMSWQAVGQVSVGEGRTGVLIINSSYLSVGFNDFRLRAAGSSNGLHAIRWDQVALKSREIDGSTYNEYGSDDGSDLDFKQRFLQWNEWVDLDNQVSDLIPKELNNSWYTNLNMFMYLDSIQVSNDLVLTLDPAWNSATGSLNVALDVWTDGGWREVSIAEVNGQITADLRLSADHLVLGYNYFRLRCAGTNGTASVVTWDQMTLQSREVAWAKNRSYSTLCAEEDNLNVPFHRKGIRSFRIIASHPKYYPQDFDLSRSDFTGCDWSIENSVRFRLVVDTTNNAPEILFDYIRVYNDGGWEGAVDKWVGAFDWSNDEFWHRPDAHLGSNWWNNIDRYGSSSSTTFPYKLTKWFPGGPDEAMVDMVFWLNEDQVVSNLHVTLRTYETVDWASGWGAPVKVACDVLGPRDYKDWINVGTNTFVGGDQHTFEIPASKLKIGTMPEADGILIPYLLYRSREIAVAAEYSSKFWRGSNSTMRLVLHAPADPEHPDYIVTTLVERATYVTLYRTEERLWYDPVSTNDPDPWKREGPQWLGLYQDGYCRLLPQPASNMPRRLSMGPSVVLGPAEEAFRPYTSITNVEIYLFDPMDSNSIDFTTARFIVSYTNGTTARWDACVNTERVILDVYDAGYDTTNFPFMTLRSMWVVDGDSDTDRLITHDMERPILKWKQSKGDHWWFTRKVPSYHQTSNPDITVQILDAPTIYLSRQGEYPSGGTNYVVQENDPAVGKKSVHINEPGEIAYDFDVAAAHSNTYIQILFADDRGGNTVTVYLDGEEKGHFRTRTTGAWSIFQYSDRLPLGTVTPGHHQLRIASDLNPQGWSDGINVDMFELLTEDYLQLPEQLFLTQQAELPSYGSGYQLVGSDGAVGGVAVTFPTTNGGEVGYCLTVTQAVPECYLRLRYSEATTNWNTVQIYLDGNKKGKFPTRRTGGWDSFESLYPVWLGALTEGAHEIKIVVEPNVEYGCLDNANLDQFTLHYTNPDETMPIGEVGRVAVDQPKKIRWHTVNFTNFYTTPVVVAQPLSGNDTNPAHVRIANVGRDRFKFQIEEWAYQDALHATEQVSFVVMEAGQHTLANGTRIEAGKDNAVGTSWKSLSLGHSFTNLPVVLVQSQTTNETEAIVTRLVAGGYGATTNTRPAKTTVPVRLGLGYTGVAFGGLLDEVKLYRSVLPDEDITGSSGGTTLAAYWKCDEAVWNGTSSEVLDASTNLNRGRSYNGAVTTNDAKIGRAGHFDGTNDYVEIPNKASLQIATNLTLSFWIKGRNYGAKRFNPLDKSYGGEFGLTIETNRSLTYYHGKARKSGKYYGWTALAAGSLTNNAWQHVVITRNTGTRALKTYLNGTLVRSTTYAYDTNKLPSASTYPVRLAKGYTGYCLGARLDEVKIDRSAWSAAAAAQEYGRGALAAYWKCDEASWNGTTNEVADSSGSNNRGTAYNGATTTSDAQQGRAGRFDGTNDYVQVPNSSSLQLNSNLTVSFWIKPSNIGAGRLNPIDKSQAGEFSLTIEPNGALTFSHGSSTNGRMWTWQALPPGSLRNGTWSQVTIVRDDSARRVRAYLNNQLVRTADVSFMVKVQEEENLGPHADEAVGYIAIDRGVGCTEDMSYEAGETPDAVTKGWYTVNFNMTYSNAPAFIGNMMRCDDPETAAVRYRNLGANNVQVRIEEEQSKDTEMNHGTESVGYLAVEPPTATFRMPVR